MARSTRPFGAGAHAPVLPVGYRSLGSAEAHSLLRKVGENVIFHKRRDRPLLALLKKFNSPLLILLMGAAAVSMYVGQWASGSIIVVMIILSAVLDFVNSYRSERVAEALQSKIVTNASVVRDGVEHAIPIRYVVPGDIVVLTAGAVLPADGILIQGDDIFVNQAALTGESFPVSKGSYQGDPAHVLSELLSPEVPHALFMGTSVVSGFGLLLVRKTGAEAAFGKIAARLAAEEPETSFDRGIRSFSFFIMRVALFMVVAVFLVNTLKGDVSTLDSLLFAIAIAVGLTPELLPVVMTVTLSRGSLKMAQKHVVVRNLPAIQNLGAMTVLATDKTGTLTEDRITLVRCVDPWGRDAHAVFEAAYVASALHSAKRTPLDDAVEQHGRVDLRTYNKVDEIPFDFSRKRGSIVYDKDGERVLVTKGAPEELVHASVAVRDSEGHRSLDENAKRVALETYERLSADGFRVLAIADRRLEQSNEREYSKDAEVELVLLGFAAFYDPPKQSAADAIKDLAALSIDVKILTGDSERLTERVCREIGLPVKGIVTGAEVAAMSPSDLAHRALEVTIFARVTPDLKERIVLALKAEGETVGYLGDGINDAPALRAADIGISVNNAVDVAKETADVILLTKSLEVLEEGIREGRRTFENTMKYVRMGFSSNFGNMTSMMGASAFLPFLPMLPAQILINNFLYDVSQTALPTDRVDADDIRRPLTWDIGAIKRYMLIFGFVSAVFDLFTFLVLYQVFGLSGGEFQTGWFLESIATQVLVVYVIRTRTVPLITSRPSGTLVGTTLAVLGFAFLLPYLPFAASIGFVPLPPSILAWIGVIVVAYLLVAEAAKRAYYREELARAAA